MVGHGLAERDVQELATQALAVTDLAAPQLDEVIHHPTRLTIMAFLAGCMQAEFAAVRDYSGVSDASISRISAALEAAGYVKIRKGYARKRPRTWLSLTPVGREALTCHLAALQAIVDAAKAAASTQINDRPKRGVPR